MIWMGLANLILAPFLVVFMIAYLLFRYGEVLLFCHGCLVVFAVVMAASLCLLLLYIHAPFVFTV